MNKSFRAVSTLLLVSVCIWYGCSGTKSPVPVKTAESEALARTEFTDRIENYFEYEPLHESKPSQVRIHLTDLSDGSPVEKAQVTLALRRNGSPEIVSETTAKIGKVTGIYVAELTVPQKGDYDIEFHVKNGKLDERLPLTGFKVE